MIPTTQSKVGFLPMHDTAPTVALMSLGVDFANFIDPATRKRICPISTERNAEHPQGQSTYALALTAANGIKTGDLLAAWHERRADIELDELLARLEGPVAEQIRAILPFALMAYYRGFSENRQRLLDLRGKGYQFQRFQRTDTGFILISENASDETRADVSLPPRKR